MISFTIPKQQTTPIIISVPHSGTLIPKETREDFLSYDPLLLNHDADLFVDELYQTAIIEDIPLLVQPYNRYVVDLNRDPLDQNASFVLGAPKIDNPPFLGLVAHKTTHGEPLLKAPLTPEQLESRVTHYHKPFHDQLAELIAQTIQKHGLCIHIDAHSMPAQASLGHKDHGLRKDIVLGDQNGKSCGSFLVETVTDYFKSQNLSVAYNQPYKGKYITEQYGRPHKKQHSLQIEINRKLYMNEVTLMKIPNRFADLKNIIQNFIKHLKLIDWNQL